MTSFAQSAAAALVVASLALCASATQAQTKKTSAKAPSKSSKTVKAVTPAIAAPIAAAAGLPAANDEQMRAFHVAHLGNYDCEFNQKITVEKASTDGYVNLKYQGQQWTMKPEMSSTGALNMNDVKGRMRYLQIGTKSMLMDASAGRRVVDACQHDKQKAFEAASK